MKNNKCKTRLNKSDKQQTPLFEYIHMDLDFHFQYQNEKKIVKNNFSRILSLFPSNAQIYNIKIRLLRLFSMYGNYFDRVKLKQMESQIEKK